MRSFEFPNGEYFTNLEMYPIQPFGIGYVRIILQFVPTVILLFYFAFLSFKFWRSGDRAAGYIIFALTIPVISFGLMAIIINLSQKGYNVAKILPFGPVKNLIPYLIRRAQENSSVGGQTNRELKYLKKELIRRNS